MEVKSALIEKMLKLDKHPSKDGKKFNSILEKHIKNEDKKKKTYNALMKLTEEELHKLFSELEGAVNA